MKSAGWHVASARFKAQTCHPYHWEKMDALCRRVFRTLVEAYGGLAAELVRPVQGQEDGEKGLDHRQW